VIISLISLQPINYFSLRHMATEINAMPTVTFLDYILVGDRGSCV